MLILDTHAFIWLASDQELLAGAAKAAIRANSENLYISSITAFEIALLVKRERLNLPLAAKEFIERALKQHNIEELLIDRSILLRAASLPDIHNDPFDRMIIASALIHNMPIITKDAKIQKYPGITTVWK